MDGMHDQNILKVVDEIDLGKDEMKNHEIQDHEMHEQEMHKMNAMEADYEIEEVIRLRQSYYMGFVGLERFTINNQAHYKRIQYLPLTHGYSVRMWS